MISEVKFSSSSLSESSQVLFQEVLSNEKMKSSCQVKEFKSDSMIRSCENKSREVPKSETEVIRTENELVVTPKQMKIIKRQESDVVVENKSTKILHSTRFRCLNT